MYKNINILKRKMKRHEIYGNTFSKKKIYICMNLSMNIISSENLLLYVVGLHYVAFGHCLNQLGRLASLNRIYIVVDSTPVLWTLNMLHIRVGPWCLRSESWRRTYFKSGNQFGIFNWYIFYTLKQNNLVGLIFFTIIFIKTCQHSLLIYIFFRFRFIKHILNMLKIKYDINQQDLKRVHLHFVKSESQLQVGENSDWIIWRSKV